jgi:hypothetical protein
MLASVSACAKPLARNTSGTCDVDYRSHSGHRSSTTRARTFPGPAREYVGRRGADRVARLCDWFVVRRAPLFPTQFRHACESGNESCSASGSQVGARADECSAFGCVDSRISRRRPATAFEVACPAVRRLGFGDLAPCPTLCLLGALLGLGRAESEGSNRLGARAQARWLPLEPGNGLGRSRARTRENDWYGCRGRR